MKSSSVPEGSISQDVLHDILAGDVYFVVSTSVKPSIGNIGADITGEAILMMLMIFKVLTL